MKINQINFQSAVYFKLNLTKNKNLIEVAFIIFIVCVIM